MPAKKPKDLTPEQEADLAERDRLERLDRLGAAPTLDDDLDDRGLVLDADDQVEEADADEDGLGGLGGRSTLGLTPGVWRGGTTLDDLGAVQGRAVARMARVARVTPERALSALLAARATRPHGVTLQDAALALLTIGEQPA
jgi:hypothetical protein